MINEKKLPYFPLYVNDFIGDTQDLTNEEIGAYLRILMYSWGKGKFRVSRIKWICQDDNIWAALAQYFIEEDGLWFNPRMERERERVFGVIEARSEAGKAGAKARWDSKGNAIANAIANADANSKEYDKNMPAYNSELITHNLELIKNIVEFLNEKANTSFRFTTPATQTVIRARLRDGFSVDDIKSVIEHKVGEWKDDPKMSEYLRPSTLFGNKFESYLQVVNKSVYVPQDRPMRSKPE